MLLEALDHPKTLHLASLLGVELPTAIGHLELLWAFTGKKAPRGDVGKFPAGAIAGACYWRGDPDAFTGALVAARFLDVDPTHALLVHDWPDHAPRWVKAKLAKARQTFAAPTVSTNAGTDAGTVVATTVATNTRSLRVEKPSQAKPSLGSGETAESRTAVPASEGTAAAAQDDAYTLTQRVQQVYPAGTYGGQAWIQTERALGILLDGGDHAAELLDAATAYAQQQQATGNVGTQYIRSPAKFYSEGHWRGPFPMPVARIQPGARRSFADIHARLSTTDDEQHPEGAQA
jgi:hypothetical protein